MEKLLKDYNIVMELNKIYNEDCLTFIPKMDDSSIDLVMTSPPYNTSRKSTSERAMKNHEVRYVTDTYMDDRTPEEYIQWCVDIFNSLEPKLKPNGIIAWNVSYSSDATQGADNMDVEWLTIADIIRNTPFSVCEHITWKKKNSIPNNVSPNKLDRICEDVFIFCRRSEVRTYHANKKVVSTMPSGQKVYKPIRNYIEAPNNNGADELNKATYSIELCTEIFKIYAPKGGTVYDPFMGSGTTAVAAIENNLKYLGTEISKAQVDGANKRIKGYRGNSLWFK